MSHLRFGPHPIHAPYLVNRAGFVGCHHLGLLDTVDVLACAEDGATLLLNAPQPADEVWDALPGPVQQQVIDKRLRLFAVDAAAVAREAGLPGRTNTVLQTCFFAISGVLPADEAVAARQGGDPQDVQPSRVGGRAPQRGRRRRHPRRAARGAGARWPARRRARCPTSCPSDAPEFVRTVTAAMMAGRGDDLPVSAMPVDGTFPSGTTAYEKRRISDVVAAWDPDACIQCGTCSFVCPHSVIRVEVLRRRRARRRARRLPVGTAQRRRPARLALHPAGLRRGLHRAAACASRRARSARWATPTRKAINLEPLAPVLVPERENIGFFETLPVNDRSRVDFGTVRGTQFLQPLFEFSGACSGCGETPYLKVLTQLFGERLTVANATGCSSIYGGNLPTTPWTKNAAGRGPAWSNSLFEDNAEFGLGLRLAADLHTSLARDPARRSCARRSAPSWPTASWMPGQVREFELTAQRERVAELLTPPRRPGRTRWSRTCAASPTTCCGARVWIVGGDGWAYDIGSGGLDHVLAERAQRQRARARHRGVLQHRWPVVEVDPGGRRGEVRGRPARRRRRRTSPCRRSPTATSTWPGSAMGADPHQTLTAFREAEAFDGPSLVIAYSHCIAHGIEMSKGLDQQYRAVASGHWPLVRYDPAVRSSGGNPFQLDSPRPRIPLEDYIYNELRYRMLRNADPAEAERLLGLAQEAVDQRWQTYEEMATRGADRFAADPRRTR